MSVIDKKNDFKQSEIQFDSPVSSEPSSQLFVEKLGLEETFAKRCWKNEPERVMLMAQVLRGLDRPSVLRVIRECGLLPLSEGKTELPARGVVSAVLRHFSIEGLFDPLNKVDLPKFFESQQIFRNLAMCIVHFLHTHPQGTSNELLEFLKERQVYAYCGLNEGDREPFYELISSAFTHFQTSSAPEHHFTEHLKGQICSLQTAMAAFRSLEQRELGISYIIDSIIMHVAELRKAEEPEQTEGEFVAELQQAVNGLVPFLKKNVTEFLSVNGKMDDSVYKTMLQRPLTLCSNPSATVASTLLQSVLQYLGYEAEIRYTLKINPKFFMSFGHAVVAVKNSANAEIVIVDPTYQQFLTLFYEEGKGIDDILVLPEKGVKVYVESLINRRKDLALQFPNALPETMSSHPLLKLSDEDFLREYQSVWNQEEYIPVRCNMVSNGLFASIPVEHGYKSASLVREAIAQLGLTNSLRVAQFEDIARGILREYLPKFVQGSLPDEERLALLEKLRMLRNTERKVFANLLKLNRAVLEKQFLSVAACGYYMSLCEQVNPNHAPGKTAIYPCSGGDISTPLLAMGPQHLLMLDWTEISINKFRQTLLAEKRSLDPMKLLKHISKIKESWEAAISSTGAKSRMMNIEMTIALELIALGVDLSKVKVDKSKEFDGITLTFPWAYHHGGAVREYTVTFVSCEVPKFSTYPKGLKQFLGKKQIDFYYQKAAMNIPQEYARFLPKITEAIKPGGWMITSDYTYHGEYFSADAHVPDFRKVASTPLSKAYLRLFEGFLGVQWISTINLLPQAERNRPPAHEYWIPTDLRQKQDQAGRAAEEKK